MKTLEQFLDEGLSINIKIDTQSAIMLGLVIFMALVLSLFLYSRFK